MRKQLFVAVTVLVALVVPAAASTAPPQKLTWGTPSLLSAPVGGSASEGVTLTNTGGAKITLELATTTFVGDPNQWLTDVGCQGVTLAKGESCTQPVTFTPSLAAQVGDVASITISARDPKHPTTTPATVTIQAQVSQ